jgi:hypothetical protein
MESGTHQMARPNGHYAIVFEAAQHLYTLTHFSDHRRSYENAMKRPSLDSADVQIFLKAVNLAAKGVAVHHYIQHAEDILPKANITGHKD